MSLFEEEISKLGIEADFLHASELYKSGEYAKEIRLALEKRDEIKAILDKYRERAKQPPLEDSWQPVMIYCPHCRKEAEFVSWDGEWKVSYKCPPTAALRARLISEKATSSSAGALTGR